jgi:hypothetical protein
MGNIARASFFNTPLRLILRASRISLRPVAAAILLLLAVHAFAQTGGQGALEGTVTDPTGAAIPGATVTAIDQASNVSTVRKSSGAGLYSITPLIPGVYTITVQATGFQALTQKNIEVNGLNVTGLNLKLAIGSADQTITVTEAPPQLQTTSATLGAVITQDTYESLPIVMNNQQRDPTALTTLAPGAQGGARTPIFSGTGNYLAELYVEGVPVTTSNQQGDNRIVANGIPVESVEQLQIQSSAPSAEYQGAGAVGFTIKSGGSKYHGQIVDFVRNTAFDTWGFAGNQQTYSSVVNGVSVAVPTGKPVEHQNEISASAGGPIPFTRGRGFFFANYDQFHGRQGVNPAVFTIATPLMTQGDFTELNCSLQANPSGCYGVGLTGTATAAAGTTNNDNPAVIFNPLTNACTGSTCTRQVFQSSKNGVLTNNVIPSSYISPISQYEQKFLPTPNVAGAGIVNNYQQGGVSGYDNHEYVFKLDYDLPHAGRLSYFFAHGVRQSVGYGAAMPLPYTSGIVSFISPTTMVLEHSIAIGSHMVNQFKFGFTRFPGGSNSPTYGVSSAYTATAAGITGLPAGQASGAFPGSAFSTTTAYPTTITPFTENGAADASSVTTPDAYTLIDNYQWSIGKHNMTFGVQAQELQDNAVSQISPSGIYTQTFSGAGTSNYAGTSLSTTNTGFSYASFLLGAVQSAGTSVPLVAETGGRYQPISPYFQDDWKVRPNLTVNLGVRYDYLPPYHEVHDNYSFFNPNGTNPVTGNLGVLEYAGNRGAAISCQCRTPINTYTKNIGPRLGIEYSPDPKTVFRAGFAIVHSRGGGVGGRAGDSGGTGQTGFGSSIIFPTAVGTGATAGPSFYLNNSAAFQAAGVANTNIGGPGYSIPAPTLPSAAGLATNVGNYLNSAGAYVAPGGAPGYADPYLAGRAPTFNFYNFSMQKVLTQNMTLTLTYSGSQSHFVAGAGVPGFWSGQLDPQYVAILGSTLASDGVTNILNAPATPANVAIVQAALPSFQLPYANYSSTASTTGSIGRALRPYPQYSSPPSATYDNIANISYNAFQLVLQQREFKGISFTVNYTYSRNVGDDGTTRSAFAVPAAVSSAGVPLAGNNRADRDLVATDLPENLNIYGVVKSPFGKGKIGGDHFLVRALAGGWQLASIFTYASGTPILITGSGCSTPSAGTCMPDIAPGRKNSIRMNGGFGGPGVTYANYSTTPYLDTTAFQSLNFFPVTAAAQAKNATPITKIGDSPRSSLNLWAPSHYNDDAAVQRSFNVVGERMKLIFRADCFDVSNKVTFSIPQTQAVATTLATKTGSGTVYTAGSPIPQTGSPSFGRLTSFSGNRRFQFSARITF